MKKAFIVLGFLMICLVPLSTHAQPVATYGPFSAPVIDNAVVEDVLVEGNDIYVKVKKDFWNSEFIVKGTLTKGGPCTTWENGTLEMPVKVYQSQAKNKQGYTYRISTKSRCVEYWTGGKMVLLLEKK